LKRRKSGKFIYVAQGLAVLTSLAWVLASHHAYLGELVGALGISMIDDVVIATVPLLIKALKAIGVVKGSSSA